jgi:hypothetical protein
VGTLPSARRTLLLIAFLTCVASTIAESQKPPVVLTDTSNVVPGKSVGPLGLGASRDVVEQAFPFKRNMDQEDTYPECGPRTEINWLDFSGGTMIGNVFVYLRNRQGFQIASATPRFGTSEGIRTGSSPDLVRSQYTGLEAYVLRPSGGQMFGFRDFIYWVSREKGIAFELAYNRNDRRRFLSKVIVFDPNTEFVPEGCIEPPQHWYKLPPYSLGDR